MHCSQIAQKAYVCYVPSYYIQTHQSEKKTACRSIPLPRGDSRAFQYASVHRKLRIPYQLNPPVLPQMNLQKTKLKTTENFMAQAVILS